MLPLEIYLAKPRGFCAGVDRAISIVETCLKHYGPPIYVKHEIVHNKFVCDQLMAKGVIFIEDIDSVPVGAKLIFSAHGVSPMVREAAKKRDLIVLDATCPLVTKVHKEAVRFKLNDYKIILIGHKEHVEVIGTVGHAPDNIVVISTVEDVEKLSFAKDDKLAFITQTTLSLYDTAEIIAALNKKFPQIEAAPKEDICYATTNRQNAVTEMAKLVDIFLVVGSYSSSNTQRLVEAAARCQKEAYLIENISDIKNSWILNNDIIGLSAGASAPESLLQAVIDRIFSIRPGVVKEFETVKESIEFPLPFELRKLINANA